MPARHPAIRHPTPGFAAARMLFSAPFLVMLCLIAFLCCQDLDCRQKTQTYQTNDDERPIPHSLVRMYHRNCLLLSGAPFSGCHRSCLLTTVFIVDVRENRKVTKGDLI
jgi:hypothetical protein